MRCIGVGVLIVLASCTASIASALPEAETPGKLSERFEIEQDRDGEVMVPPADPTAEPPGLEAQAGKEIGSCASSEAPALFTAGEPSDLFNVNDPQRTAAAGNPCLCSENCCTGCPGICCVGPVSLGGACTGVASCYRLDCAQ